MQPKPAVENAVIRAVFSRDFAADLTTAATAAALLDAMQIKGFISAVARNGAYGNADVTRSRAPELLSENAHTPFPCTHFHSRAQVVRQGGEKKKEKKLAAVFLGFLPRASKI